LKFKNSYFDNAHYLAFTKADYNLKILKMPKIDCFIPNTIYKIFRKDKEKVIYFQKKEHYLF